MPVPKLTKSSQESLYSFLHSLLSLMQANAMPEEGSR